MSAIPSYTCPVCRSDKVRRFTAFDGDEWWSECVSGRDHGLYVLPDGSRRKWPERLRFTKSGWFETADGKLKVHGDAPMNASRIFASFWRSSDAE